MPSFIDTLITMLQEHWFWGGLTLAVLVWYSTITVYVAFKGVTDIKNMLRHLGGVDRNRPGGT
jgi:hypothetical protein